MSITGTLPLTMTKANPMLEFLLISRNKISGTIGQHAFKSAIYLSNLLISQNFISGSLPEQQLEPDSSGHSWSNRGVEMATGFPLGLTTLLANGLKLSGSLPRLIGAENKSALMDNQQQQPINDSFTLVSGPCTIDAEGCALSPNWPRRYDDNQNCSLETNLAGWGRTTHFETELYFDYLYVSYWAFSGDVGVLDYYLPAQSPISFTSDGHRKKSGWRLCLFEGPNITARSGHFIHLESFSFTLTLFCKLLQVSVFCRWLRTT